MLSSGRRAAKWHFNTNSLSCLPPQGFHRLRGTRSGLSFPPLVSPDVKRCCSGEQFEKSPILFAPPHLPRSPGPQVPSGAEEMPRNVRTFMLLEKWPPLRQVPTLATLSGSLVLMSSTCLPRPQTPAPAHNVTLQQVSP